MCGICAVLSNNIVSKELDFFKKLFIISSLRGLDSAGTLFIRERESGKKKKTKTLVYTVLKDNTNCINFMETHQPFEGFYKDGDRKLLLGHCRSATIGNIIKANAHPFMTKNVIGVHNGTMRSRNPKDETDSEHFYKDVSDNGIEAAIKKLSRYQDAYALVYFDLEDCSINVLRNKDRPLSFAYSKTLDTLFMASEHIFLHFLLVREGMSKDFKIEEYEPNILYTYHRETINGKITYDIENPEKKKLEPDIFSTVHHSSHNYRYNGDVLESEPWKNSPRYYRTAGGGAVVPIVPRSGTTNSGHLIDLSWRINNVRYAKYEIEKKLAENVCDFCDKPGNIEKFDKIFWVNHIKYICADCVELEPDLIETAKAMVR